MQSFGLKINGNRRVLDSKITRKHAKFKVKINCKSNYWIQKQPKNMQNLGQKLTITKNHMNRKTNN